MSMETIKSNLTQNMETIWRVTDLLQKSQNLQETFDIAMTQIIYETKAESGTLWICDENRESITPVILHGPNVKGMKNLKLKYGEGIAGSVVKTGKRVIIQDVKNESGWAKRFDNATGYETRTMLCVPLFANDSCIGTIQLVNRRDGGLFHENDLELCEAIADLFRIAIERKGFYLKDLKIKETLISLENITKNYSMGEIVVEALKEVSIDVYEGELLVILGASGSGKSTLLNLIGGMDQPTSGTITINNRNLSNAGDRELTDYRKHDIGFVFQFYNLIPDLTAGENISIAAELVDSSRDVDEVLEEVGLLHKKNNFPSQMSGGEQQRVSIARALVKRPRILLCDEPTGALDYESGKMIICLLEKIARKFDGTVIIVTHNANFGAIADRVIKMRSGRIVEITTNANPTPAERIEW